MSEFDTMNPIIVYKPVVEPDFGQERFLTADPVCLMESGNFHRMPVIAGITEYEFLFPAISMKGVFIFLYQKHYIFVILLNRCSEK